MVHIKLSASRHLCVSGHLRETRGNGSHLSLNQRVQGSNPCTPTKLLMLSFDLSFRWYRVRLSNSLVPGNNRGDSETTHRQLLPATFSGSLASPYRGSGSCSPCAGRGDRRRASGHRSYRGCHAFGRYGWLSLASVRTGGELAMLRRCKMPMRSSTLCAARPTRKRPLHVEDLVRKGPDEELARVNALSLRRPIIGSTRRRPSRRSCTTSRLGLFEMSWNILCPELRRRPRCERDPEERPTAGLLLRLLWRGERAAPRRHGRGELSPSSPRVRRIGVHDADGLSFWDYYRQSLLRIGRCLP